MATVPSQAKDEQIPVSDQDQAKGPDPQVDVRPKQDRAVQSDDLFFKPQVVGENKVKYGLARAIPVRNPIYASIIPTATTNNSSDAFTPIKKSTSASQPKMEAYESPTLKKGKVDVAARAGMFGESKVAKKKE